MYTSTFDVALVLRTAVAHDQAPSHVLADLPGRAIDRDNTGHVVASSETEPARFTVADGEGNLYRVTVEHA
jgi:hypothetical protein